MRKLSKNSKAVLGAATFLLFAFAGAQAGALHLQLQHLDSSALRSQGLSAPAGSQRLAVTASHFTLAKNRRPADRVVADTSFISLAQRLGFAGAVSCEALAANDARRGCSALPRAPPLS